MSRIFKKHYSAFQRHILKEFMTEKELVEIDKKYNEAKKEREESRKLGKELERISKKSN